jgi:hypothetical protein
MEGIRCTPCALASLLLLAACTQAPAPVASTPAPTPSVDAAPVAEPVAMKPVPIEQTPCAPLADIDQFPGTYGGTMTDPDYLAIKDSGRAAIPCLVDAIADATPMQDPAKKSVLPDFALGDLAFFLLVDYGYVDFLKVLPPDVRTDTQTRGVFAFFDWIGVPGHRELLQARVRQQIAAQHARVAVR